MDSTDNSQWITTTEAVRITGLSEGMLRKMAHEGKLDRHARGRGKSARYRREQIERLAREREEKGAVREL